MIVVLYDEGGEFMTRYRQACKADAERPKPQPPKPKHESPPDNWRLNTRPMRSAE